VTGFSAAVRTTIRQRADGYCERCGLQRGTEIHHRRPRGMGGTNRPETNAPSSGGLLCGDCHRWAESHRAAAMNHGWLVPANTTNPQTSPSPHRYRGRAD
jgi:5-methylcytosine-specific restriction protein A